MEDSQQQGDSQSFRRMKDSVHCFLRAPQGKGRRSSPVSCLSPACHLPGNLGMFVFQAPGTSAWGFAESHLNPCLWLLLNLWFCCHHQEGSGQKQWQFNDSVDDRAQGSWEILLGWGKHRKQKHTQGRHFSSVHPQSVFTKRN